MPDDDDGKNKGLRILRLGDKPGGTADLEELKDSIADELQEQFGDYEDTGTLIDHAVKVMMARMEALEDQLAKTARAGDASQGISFPGVPLLGPSKGCFGRE